MAKLKTLALIAFIGLSICGCGLFRKVPKNTNTNTTLGASAMYGQTYTINDRQLDSVCFADKLSYDLNDWIKSTYLDYETNKIINKYIFIKTLNEKEEMVYILMPVDTLYELTKRFVREVEE